MDEKSEDEDMDLSGDSAPENSGLDDDEEEVAEPKLGPLSKGKTSTSDKKKSVAGIIYLSIIPPGMNVKTIREYFGQYGEINRSFLQPEDKGWKSKLKKAKIKNQTFTEGWIEFKKRRHAKKVAATLNNCPVGGKKNKAYHDVLWNIKYLKGFQWVHLNERLAYERISRQQKLRAEVSAAKREANYFAKSVSLSRKLKRNKVEPAKEPPTS